MRAAKTTAFIIAGVFAIAGFLGTSVLSVSQPTDQAKPFITLGAKALSIAWLIAVVAAYVFDAILDRDRERKDKKRRRKQKRREKQRDKEIRKLAELLARQTKLEPESLSEPEKSRVKPVTGMAHGLQGPQTGNAGGAVKNIADDVKAGKPFVRFEWANITSLREAGLRLAKLYRDFAEKPVDQTNINSGQYIVDFWAHFPFGEFSAVKDRMRDVLGFEVTPPTEVLPSEPDRIRRLAKHLEKEALKVPENVPL